jgi:predicted acetyltransferase
MTAICLESYERTLIKRSFWLCLDEAIGFALVLEEPATLRKVALAVSFLV